MQETKFEELIRESSKETQNQNHNSVMQESSFIFFGDDLAKV
jgi:hypothetical protein